MSDPVGLLRLRGIRWCEVPPEALRGARYLLSPDDGLLLAPVAIGSPEAERTAAHAQATMSAFAVTRDPEPGAEPLASAARRLIGRSPALQ